MRNGVIGRSTFFVAPPAVGDAGGDYCQGFETYSGYNYLRPGLSSYIKTRHFETALRLTRAYFGSSGAIDFGCADGPFLPSLSRYFQSVLAVDRDPVLLNVARRVVQTTGLTNVQLLCNQDIDDEAFRHSIQHTGFKVLYLLETIEHVGEREDLYPSKVRFITSLFRLLDPGGVIVLSVPKMTGLSFLIQRMGLALMGMSRESMSRKDFFRSVFLSDTSCLEQRWDGGHLGFNHRMLEQLMRETFTIQKTRDLFFQKLYLLTNRED